MSLPGALYGALARPALFALDAERAHELTVGTLARVPAAGCAFGRAGDDPIELFGLTFRNRIGLAAGLDKNAACVDAWDAMGFGFCELGTLTPRPQPGNPKPRMFRLPQHRALINRLGFNNVGIQAGLGNLARAGARRPIVGLNIGKNKDTPETDAAADYCSGLAQVHDAADYVTINVSSPNTEGLRKLQGGDARNALLAGLQRTRQKLADATGQRTPVLVKLAPDLDADALREAADSIVAHGFDGIVATNTTTERSAVAGHRHAGQAGGLSGEPVRQASNRALAILAAHLQGRLPLIGVGGVSRPEHAVEKLEAGASLVQVYTGLIYAGPALVPRCVDAMRAAS